MKLLERVGRNIHELLNPAMQPVVLTEVFYGPNIQLPSDSKIRELKTILTPIVEQFGCRMTETLQASPFEDSSLVIGLTIAKGNHTKPSDFLSALGNIQTTITDAMSRQLIKESDAVYPAVLAARDTICSEFQRRSSHGS